MEGYTINFDKSVLNIIQSPADNSKFCLQGPTGSGKSAVLLERYRYLVEQLNVPSEKILLLILNKSQSLEWRNKTIFKGSGTIWRTSYYGFVQGEIKTFYPLVLKNCSNIVEKNICPVFLSFESARFLVSKVIDRSRERLDAFSGITSYNDRIAQDLTSNLLMAAMSDVPFREIGDRLFNSLEFKDDIKKKIFKDIDDILDRYKSKCLQLGVLDFGMAVDLYNNCLLKEKLYTTQLFKRVEHLIVDNFEERLPAEVDFIELLLPNLKTCLLGYNIDGGQSSLVGNNREYLKQRIIGKCDAVGLSKSHTCNDYMSEFSEMLFENIMVEKPNSSGQFKKLTFFDDIEQHIERNPPFELRSEMMEKVGERVIKLISEDGFLPSDIVILSTYADPVTEYVIGSILERKGYRLRNLSRKNRVQDNPYLCALITLSQLCHPSYRVLPSRENIRALIMLLFKIDPVRSSIIAGEICKGTSFPELPDVGFLSAQENWHFSSPKYKYVKGWINEYRNSSKPLPINDFLQKAFLEVLISKEMSKADIFEVKNIIDRAQTFVDTVSRFGRNADKDFLEMLTGEMKSTESIFELEEKLHGEYVLLSTPIAYLSTSLSNKVIILTSLSSKNWMPRSIKELTNPHVLTKTWDSDAVYTEAMEESNQKHYIAVLIRAILKRCAVKLITFESDLSANGFENDGYLSEYFDEGMTKQ